MNNSKGFKIACVIGIVEIVLSLLLTVAGAFPVGIPLLLIGIFIVVGSRKAQKKNLEAQQKTPQLQSEPPKEKENTPQTSEQESDIAQAAYNSVMEKRVDYAPQTSEQYTLIYKDAAGNETRRVIDLQGLGVVLRIFHNLYLHCSKFHSIGHILLSAFAFRLIILELSFFFYLLYISKMYRIYKLVDVQVCVFAVYRFNFRDIGYQILICVT